MNFFNKKIWSMLILVLLCILSAACGGNSDAKSDVRAGSYEVTDSIGRTVKIPHKPQRIVTLTMYADFISLGLVDSSRMAAVSIYLDDPKESTVVEKAKKIKNKVTAPTIEEIVAWKPDLIIASVWTAPEAIAAYQDMGIPVVICNRASNYEEIKECVKIISTAVGEQEKGRQMIDAMENKMGELQAKVANISADKRKSVLLLSVMTDFGGVGSFFDDMCKFAGVKNSLAEIGLQTGQPLTKELIVKSNPDVIFLPNYDDHGAYDTQKFIDSYLHDPALQSVNAIKNRAVYTPRDYYIYNCSQDFVYGVQEICYYAYGEEFKLPDGMNISFSDEKF